MKAYEETRTKSPADARWEALSALRWGPAVADPTPGIDVPRDWRSEVAAWPSERWLRWRSLTEELQAGLEGEPTVEDIRATARAAFDLIRDEGR